MIIDTINNARKYTGISNAVQRALGVIERYRDQPIGNYPIDGDSFYVMVSESDTRPPESALWETHRNYMDIHVILSGCEQIGYADTRSLSLVKPYNPDKDIEFLAGEGSFLTCAEGSFVIFFTGESHMPDIQAGSPSKIRKLVIKIKP